MNDSQVRENRGCEACRKSEQSRPGGGPGYSGALIVYHHELEARLRAELVECVKELEFHNEMIAEFGTYEPSPGGESRALDILQRARRALSGGTK